MSARPKSVQARPVEKPSLTLKRRLDAPPSKVFAAWTDPEKLVHWFGPADTVDGRMNLIGALRRSMATTGYSDLKEFQRVEVVVAPYHQG